jgi:serine phosphatase RsbU (regulator of sigma subunit)
MNEYLEATLPDESFVTAICLTYDPATGRIESSNAGHPPAMIVGVDGKVRELPSGENPPLGYLPVPYETHEHQLEPGELLSLFTDGLTELGNEKDEMLGIPGVAQMHEKLYAAGKSDPAEQLAKKLIDLLNAFEGRAIRGDDRTFMLVRRV